MTIADLITAGQLILGVVWGVGMLILLRRNKSEPDMWPRIFGVGGGLFMFALSILGSLEPRPTSEFVDYISSNFFWSVAIGIIAYFSGRILARDAKNRKK